MGDRTTERVRGTVAVAVSPGADLADLGNNYPLMEDTIAWNGSTVTSQAQINTFANGQVGLRTQAMTQPVIVVGAGQFPRAGDIILGDGCLLIATSPLHPATADGKPGLITEVRISGWTCTPPSANQQESLQIATSGVITP